MKISDIPKDRFTEHLASFEFVFLELVQQVVFPLSLLKCPVFSTNLFPAERKLLARGVVIAVSGQSGVDRSNVICG